jgi:large subunit ribosomal protein L4
MLSLDVYSTTGKKTTTLAVKKKFFQAKINSTLMAQAVRVYLSNQRQAPAQTKLRGEIKVTKKKVWRQKGTGKARHGSRNAPIFVGGAKAHGPKDNQNFKITMSKKMKKLSLFSALTSQLKEKNVICLTGLDKLEPKTKLFDKTFQKLSKESKKLTLVISADSQKLIRPTKNIPYLTTFNAKDLNTYQVLKTSKLIFTKDAIKAFEAHYAN